MGDKYKVRDERTGREFTIERELSPTEQAERVGRQASMWFWVFAIFGGFLILIPIWVISRVIELTRRYPVVMIPVLLGSLAVGIYTLNASVNQAEAITTLIRVHTLNVVYHNEQSSSSFKVTYQLFNDDTKGRRVSIGVQVPVTFTNCREGEKQVPDRAVTFGASSGSLFVVQTVGAAAHASSVNTVDAAWSNEGSSPSAYLEQCRMYSIGQPVYQLRVDGPFGSEWRPLSENSSSQSATTPVIVNTAAPQKSSIEQPTVQSTISVSVRHVTGDVKLHAKPGIDEPTVIVLKTGTEVTLLGDSIATPDGITWVKVQAGPLEGWCSAKYISENNQASTGASEQTPLPAPSFEYPFDGQALDVEGTYLFKVHPIEGADGYIWGFSQDGVLLWENQRDEHHLSSNEYAILQDTRAHDVFVVGDVQVSVRAVKSGTRSDAATITVRLRPRTQ